MEKTFDLESYLAAGVKSIVSDILKAALSDPKGSVFMARYAARSRRSAKLRAEAAKNGLHIPPFLIASVAVQCNLRCAGCYARANQSCYDNTPCDMSPKQLTALQWADIFRQAAELGVSFILLAGGEPFLRLDVLSVAGERPEILFPVFTNGTLINGEYLALLEQKRNLIPVISLEGDRETTDARRGEGTYDRLRAAMRELDARGLLFGASVTVTKENAKQVISEEFIGNLSEAGC